MTPPHGTACERIEQDLGAERLTFQVPLPKLELRTLLLPPLGNGVDLGQGKRILRFGRELRVEVLLSEGNGLLGLCLLSSGATSSST